jgi:hypothetical protein
LKWQTSINLGIFHSFLATMSQGDAHHKHILDTSIAQNKQNISTKMESKLNSRFIILAMAQIHELVTFSYNMFWRSPQGLHWNDEVFVTIKNLCKKTFMFCDLRALNTLYKIDQMEHVRRCLITYGRRFLMLCQIF